ncbi:MAG: 4-alpha-glucanotransferase [Gammaproteobacteria bacterium]|uniref:4-alpha-glucanotransferase n=1 Tax=Rhodoferax sp. TaxID=50421 RepID=UPI0017FFBF14|nr:4-alpha-glucanotransferase [Rhodoferax sp.]MBU3898269.1 4-alpha-glucanotransferase [Gammaproteobacteria bacterium]MBA3059033.1 4-alpha-glucanotransferase [Rhodoferax sp.]MBU3997019.1 4-alpha-glucanotransferase [Gammaproteobacteria bacterium]MBU4081454.1 4-alpha-glucanotransferase [Gammaproteobacteria bacterium]MBU4114233.1 4-alpha-glucanotransferase [Gammaproteobacteria bacterium]
MSPAQAATAGIFSQRSSGVLLHLSSLPSPHGSGDLGAEAYHFVDWLVSAGQRLWQILPLSPAGPGNSPYHSPATFAGNPLLVDLEELVQCGWLSPQKPPSFEPGRCDFELVGPYRMRRLREAWQGFLDRTHASDWAEFERFRVQQAHWLEGYAFFMALEIRHGKPWTQWPAGLSQADPAALAGVAESMADDLGFFSFIQWRFMVQWQHLRDYAHQHGVLIVGDAPIFVAHHSADVWLNTELFLLDSQGEPTVVAGVPPDYFSTTGQRWGNPLYRWDVMAENGFSWWNDRLSHLLELVDVIRLDHFRGFESYWEIPANEPTAVAGWWRAGPGQALFDALVKVREQHGGGSFLPIIAEDLGIITPAVTDLRQNCGFPGMRVMQFAFGDTAGNPYLPHNFDVQTVAYTGTHDNDTTLGWWQTAGAGQRRSARAYLGPLADLEIHWAMMQSLSQSRANTVIFPFQDVLGLDGLHRMNTPGMAQGCWQWRFEWRQVGDAPARRLADMTRAHGRNLLGQANFQ